MPALLNVRHPSQRHTNPALNPGTRHLTQADIEQVNFAYADLNEMWQRYIPDQLQPGWNETADGEKFFLIPTPSAGLWATKEKLFTAQK